MDGRERERGEVDGRERDVDSSPVQSSKEVVASGRSFGVSECFQSFDCLNYRDQSSSRQRGSI